MPEQDQQAALGERGAGCGQHLGHRLRADIGTEQHEDEQDEPAQHRRPASLGRGARHARAAAEQAPPAAAPSGEPAHGTAGIGLRSSGGCGVEAGRHGLSASAGRM